MRLSELIPGNKTLYVFDFDDSLAHSDAVVNVIKGDTIIKSLSPINFVSYKLGTGEKYDFSDFDNTSKKHHSIDQNVEMFKKTIKNNNAGTYVLTARSNYVPVKIFLAGIGVKIVRIVALGSGDPQKKKEWIRSKLNSGQYGKLLFVDDSIKNLMVVASLRKEFPQINIITYTLK